jgi:hypothetical protein
MIMTMRANGVPNKEVALALNNAGLANVHGQPWIAAQVVSRCSYLRLRERDKLTPRRAPDVAIPRPLMADDSRSIHDQTMTIDDLIAERDQYRRWYEQAKVERDAHRRELAKVRVEIERLRGEVE